MMETVLYSIVIFANLVLAIVVYKNNSKSDTNRIFSLLAIATTAWLLSNYISLLPRFLASSLFWIRLSIFFAIPQAMLLFFLANIIPYDKLRMDRKYLLLYLLITVAIMIINISPLSFPDVDISTGTPNPTPGFGLIPFAFMTLLFFSGSIVSLFTKIKKTTGVVREQVRAMMFGIIAMLGLIIITIMLPLLILRINFFVQFAPIYTFLFLGTTAYSIIRHKFLDIRVIVARSVSYSLLLFVLILIYTALIFTATELLPDSFNATYVHIAMALVVAFSFNPLRNFLESITDKFLFKGRYDTEELLSELTNIMASEIDIEQLSNTLLGRLLEQVRLVKGAFILIEKGAAVRIESVGFGKEIPLTDKELTELAYRDRETYIFEELSDGYLKDLFRRVDISGVFTLKVKNEPIGLLVLGPKASGEIFSSQDVDLFEILAPQAAVALQNAQSYRAIQEFSKTLEAKVEDRTHELKVAQKRELDKANELLKLKDEFVFIATHDLRTPVTAIRGYIDLIEHSPTGFDENNKENFGAIKESSNRLNQLVNDLLEVARSEAGTIKIEPHPVNIVEIIENAITQITPPAKEKGLTLNREFDPEHKMVMGDEEKLHEVLENLLSNAVKYNKENGYITVKTEFNEDRLTIEVEDTGYGIPVKHQKNVFQKFFKSRTEDTKGVAGTGLGLFVVRMLIEKMNGEINFKSEEGKGTKFCFNLPIAKEENTRPSASVDK